MFANSLIVSKSIKYIANIIDQYNSAFFYIRCLKWFSDILLMAI